MSAHTRPETMREARTWEVVKNRALDYGLCHACAAQLAYGHQLGFTSTTHEPCGECLWIVATLPVAKSNGWRTVAGEAASREAWNAVEGDSLPVSAQEVPGAPRMPETGTHERAVHDLVGVSA
ncbi:hypothetical protein GCG21_09725 [Pseudactinotalea sp. HY160]|uniref:hypothetical protein n=1 Tax=Pseudactinotalea sp. HY160 TaxID=2654490 RepID=UPI00128E647E|nr:hypothetical protein [Pseudactinotalea sp. HY160]MPV50276.1 hypothetical protein [Pseudactinotalea sp. HY160]